MLVILWTLFSNATTIRDNFFPAEWQAKLATLTLVEKLPKWDWHVWLLGVAALVIAATLEGTYRVHRAELEELRTAPVPPPVRAENKKEKPEVKAPIETLVERRPVWKDVYGRDDHGRPWLSEQPEPRGPWGYGTKSVKVASVVLPIEARCYLQSVRARLTYMYQSGVEIVRQGCWLESEYENEIGFRTGDIRYMVAYMCSESEDGAIVYAVPHDQRNSGQTIPNLGLSADEAVIVEGGRIKAEFFIGGKVGPEFIYEMYLSEGKVQLRSVETRRSTKQ